MTDGESTTMTGLVEGTVKRVHGDRGFAFLLANGVEYFAHRSEVVDSQFGELREGDRVSFEPQADGPKGPRASGVRRLP